MTTWWNSRSQPKSSFYEHRNELYTQHEIQNKKQAWAFSDKSFVRPCISQRNRLNVKAKYQHPRILVNHPNHQTDWKSESTADPLREICVATVLWGWIRAGRTPRALKSMNPQGFPGLSPDLFPFHAPMQSAMSKAGHTNSVLSNVHPPGPSRPCPNLCPSHPLLLSLRQTCADPKQPATSRLSRVQKCSNYQSGHIHISSSETSV